MIENTVILLKLYYLKSLIDIYTLVTLDNSVTFI